MKSTQFNHLTFIYSFLFIVQPDQQLEIIKYNNNKKGFAADKTYPAIVPHTGTRHIGTLTSRHIGKKAFWYRKIFPVIMVLLSHHNGKKIPVTLVKNSRCHKKTKKSCHIGTQCPSHWYNEFVTDLAWLHILHSSLINEKGGIETIMALLARKICHDQNSPEFIFFIYSFFIKQRYIWD